MIWIILASLAIAAAAFWILWLVAKEFYVAAKAKGYYEKKYLWICFLLGVIGYLLVIALPDRGNVQQTTSDELPDL